MVIAAIAHAPSPLLIGKYAVPVKTTIKHFLSINAPELGEGRENIETALTFLNNAAGAFRTTTEKMRDLAAKDRAEAGIAATKQADAALQAAMHGSASAKAN